MGELKDQAIAHIEANQNRLFDLSRKIHANPELAYEEFQASSWLSRFLEAQGFSVEREAGGLPTALVATLSGKTEGPAIAFLAEYDALPEVGHGCGHNLIGVGAVGAAVGLSAVMPLLPGTLQVVGTPAEEFTEGKAGKIRLLEEGVFAGVDACLMFHPWTETAVAQSDLGFMVLDVTFRGKPAHASADPWNGLNALDGVVLTYSSLSLLRQQMKPDARIHCMIMHGGDAVNIIPERASIRVMFRSPDSAYLEGLRERIEECTKGAALATGTEIDIHKVTHVQNSRFNAALYGVAKGNMAALGERLPAMAFWGGSSDFGNVSQALPALSLLVKTHEPGINWHSKAVTEGAISERAHAAMLLASKTMAMIAIDLLTEPKLLESVRRTFEGP